jgi:hypothetical protein
MSQVLLQALSSLSMVAGPRIKGNLEKLEHIQISE